MTKVKHADTIPAHSILGAEHWNKDHVITEETVIGHKTSHQKNGSDFISVEGLEGLLEDSQTPLAHKSSHEREGSDELDAMKQKGIAELLSNMIIVAKQPILALPFDEGSGATAYDKSGNGRNGSIYGASWVNGKLGKALQFNGTSDYVETANNFPVLTNISICVWVKLEAQLGSYASLGCCDDNWGVQGGFILMWNYPTADKWQFRVYNPNHTGASPAVNVPNGAWHFLVATYDGSTLRIYLDGTESGSGTAFAYGMPSFTSKFRIGKLFSIYFTKGIIDEYMIFDKALTASEIMQLYLLTNV